MRETRRLAARYLCATLAVSVLIAASACGSSSDTQTSTTTPGQPGQSGATQQYTPTGALTVDATTATRDGEVLTASDNDESAVLVENGGALTLTNPTITTTGNSSSSDESSFYGLNAGVLALAGSSVKITGGSVTTSGDGANGVFAYGEGSMATLTDTTVNATGQYAHGIMTSGIGSITATNVTAYTTGASSATIATDRGGGTIAVTGGSYTTTGQNSPAIYSTGAITCGGGTYTATGSESVAIEGANSVTLTDATVSSDIDNKWGVLIYQSMSGDAEGVLGVFTMTGGSLTHSGSNGPLFEVTNTTASITLSGVDVSVADGVLVNAGASSWGTDGANGGTVQMTADAQTLVGDLVADSISSIALSLANGSTLTGTFNGDGSAASADLTLDGTSSWTVTGDSHLDSLVGAVVSGGAIANITGNGHTVAYDASLAANAYLGGGTYTLAGGGELVPE